MKTWKVCNSSFLTMVKWKCVNNEYDIGGDEGRCIHNIYLDPIASNVINVNREIFGVVVIWRWSDGGGGTNGASSMVGF